MKNLFIHPNLLINLKEIGFNEPCLIADDEQGEEHIVYYVHENGTPTYQQVIDWFEDNHKIIVYVKKGTYGSWFGNIVNDYTKTHIGSGNFKYFDNEITVNNDLNGFKTKYEALDKTIEEAIKLIK